MTELETIQFYVDHLISLQNIGKSGIAVSFFPRRQREDYVKRLPAPKFQEWKDIETQAFFDADSGG